MSYTVIHATHEAVQKVGGIGAVLDGLITSAVYQKEIGRSFLVGPLESPGDERVLSDCGEVIFSTISAALCEKFAGVYSRCFDVAGDASGY